MSDDKTPLLNEVAVRIGKFSLCAENQLTGTKFKKRKERTNQIDHSLLRDGNNVSWAGVYSKRWAQKDATKF
jgi:hypothetical protein